MDACVGGKEGMGIRHTRADTRACRAQSCTALLSMAASGPPGSESVQAPWPRARRRLGGARARAAQRRASPHVHAHTHTACMHGTSNRCKEGGAANYSFEKQ
jgi:hypothetical protein